MNLTEVVNSTEPVLPAEAAWNGLTQAELVIVGAVGAVVILATGAVILRLIMPRIRRGYAKEVQIPKKPVVEEKTGRLLAPGTPSSMSSRSSSSRLSNQGDWSDGNSYKTKSTYFSQNNLYPGKSSSFGNLRQQAVLNSANASPASYRSKTTERLNDDLISMISQQSLASQQSRGSQQYLLPHTQSILEPLNLGEQYRSNWEQALQVEHPEPHTNLGFTSHSSENISTERYDTYPFRHSVQKPDGKRQIPVIIYPESTKL